MNTLEVENFLRNDRFARKIFKGVYAIDQLNFNNIQKPAAYIINTDPSNKPGEHWFAMIFPKNGPIEYFDPYGLAPINGEIKQIWLRNKNNFIFNRKKIQSFDSTNCGKYSIFYIYLRARNIPITKINSFFLKNKLYNEKIIVKIFNKLIS